MTSRCKTALTATLALLVAGVSAPQALASGFQLREQSPSAQGNAFAGITAKGADISSMFFNPATMTQFDGLQFVGGFSYVAPKAELSNASGSRALLPVVGSTTITGPNTHPDAANNAVLPNLYVMWSVSKDFKLGLSVNAPFGLVTEYEDTFVGRYHALKSDLKTVDVAFNAAYRLHPMVSVGASLIYRKVDTELSNAVDFGAIDYAASGFNAAFAPSSSASPFDGKATIKGDTSVMGYKVGLTIEPTQAIKIGLSYHGATKVGVEGTVTYQYPTVPAPLQPTFDAIKNGAHLVDGKASADVDLPDSLSLGMAFDVTPEFNLAIEASRTGWSKFKELRVKFGSGQADSVTEENWRNTMYLALGGTWKATEALSLRLGLATDQGAVEDAYRTPRIPDGDRTWFSTGLSYAFSKSVGLDFAYTHITVKESPLALKAGSSAASPNFFRGNLSGTYKNSIDILAVAARFNF